jgi:VanZ family protein
MKRLAFIFGLIIIIIVILADTRHLGPLGAIYDFPYGDKVGHFFLFGLFSLVVNLSVFESRSVSAAQSMLKPDYKRSAIITSLIIAVFVGLEELSQLWFPSRTSNAFDLLASYLGIAFFTWLSLRIKKKE